MYDIKPIEDVREVFNDEIHTGYNPKIDFGHGLGYAKFEMGIYYKTQLALREMKH